MIYFTSDLHLGHARIIELVGRPFDSLDEMHEVIIRRWNERVAADDAVWVLGDVALGSIRESLDVVRRLNGHKFLVPGNHDRCFSEYRKNGPRPQDFQLYTDVGFVVEPEHTHVVAVTAKRGAEVWTLSHFPYTGDSHELDRYVHMRPRDEGRVLLHGHTHRARRIDGRQVHVGVDAWDFQPVSADEIADLLDDQDPPLKRSGVM